MYNASLFHLLVRISMPYKSIIQKTKQEIWANAHGTR